MAKKPVARKTADIPDRALAAPAMAPGVTVAARITKTIWYIGKILEPVASGFKVEYLTGEKRKVKSPLIVPIPVMPIFRSGDAVIAVWKGAVMYRGLITAVVPDGYTVKWDDGTPATTVPPGQLTFAAWA